MMKKDYVSLKVAKLLKERGFDWECERFVEKDPDSEREEWCDNKCIHVYPKPSLYMVKKWLIDVYKIYIVIKPHYSICFETVEFSYEVYFYLDLLTGGEASIESEDYYTDYYQCLNDAIFETLKSPWL